MMQKTNFAFEVLIHDDASTDKSAEIIREYEAKYPDIIKPIYQTENQYSKGVGVTRVFQFPRAKGKYIAMCEGDDYWTDPYKLQKQVDFLEENEGYGFIGTRCRVLKKDNLIVEEEINIPNWRLNSKNILIYDNVFEYAKYGPVTRTVSLLFERSLIQNYINEINGDYTLQAILSRQTKFACLNDICCVYRLHNGGVSNSNDYGGQIRYVNWYIQNRLMLNRLFPGECDFSEDELYDKERYLRLKLAISQFKYSEAIAVKDQIKTKMYRSKTYSKYMCNYVFFYMLYLHLKFIANEK
jgi:glycosyltransferase involved in cell wall biosynthesis